MKPTKGKYWITGLIWCFTTLVYSQPNSQFKVNFIPVFGDEVIALNEYYHLSASDSIQFTMLRFYISNVQIKRKNQTIWKEDLSYHLLDMEDSTSFGLNCDKVLKNSTIEFSIGVDSATNVYGVMGGDLDPTEGMYWTWQTGYVNFKLEGNSNLIKNRYHEFQYHIGGYAYPNNTYRTLSFPLKKRQKAINLYIDIEALVKSIDVQKEDYIMSPGQKANAFSNLFSSIIKEMK